MHAARAGTATSDADMVSGMLVAIRTFVEHSFRTSGEPLESMRVGEVEVSIATGPLAVLAAVIRGAMSADLKARFQETIEQIHIEFSAELAAFRGDAAPFEPTAALLRPYLQDENAGRWIRA